MRNTERACPMCATQAGGLGALHCPPCFASIGRGAEKGETGTMYRLTITNNNVLHTTNNNENNIYGLYYWIFPNLMLNFYSWGLSINIIEPISINKTRIRFLSYPLKNNQQPSKGRAALSQVEKEDQSVVLSVQKGIRSRFYNSGRYSPKHEKGIHYFHLLLNKYLS